MKEMTKEIIEKLDKTEDIVRMKELKDKLKMEDMMDAAYEQSIVQDTQDLNAARDAILALVNLGYSNSEAALAVKKIGDTSQMDIESILKAALKKLI